MTDWIDPELFDSFALALRARPGLSGVEIFTAAPAKGNPFTDAVALFGTEHEAQVTDWDGGGEDNVTIHGSVYSQAEGLTGDIAKQVRDRAGELLGEVFAQVEADRTLGGFVGYAQVKITEFDQGVTDANTDRFAEVKFRIAAKVFFDG